MSRRLTRARRRAGHYNFGTKGGTSATAGKRSAVYLVPLPDGTVVEKASFKASGVDRCSAWVYPGRKFVPTRGNVPGYYELTGTWFVAAVREENFPGELSHMTRVEAVRKGIKQNELVPLDLLVKDPSECHCGFTVDPNDPDENTPEKTWHYYRKCKHCGYLWWSLHCPHEQHSCPSCDGSTGVNVI